MSLLEARQLAEDMKRFCSEFNFIPTTSVTGGDIFFHKDVWDILAIFKKVGMIAVLGNPEFLSDKVIRHLEDVGVEAFQLSVDGLEKTHDMIRRPGSFNQTVKALDRLQGSSMRVGVMSAVSEWNYQEIPDVMELVYSLGAEWTFNRYVPRKGTCGISPEVYRKFLSSVVKKHIEIHGDLNSLPDKDPLMQTVLPRKHGPYNSIIQGCSLGSMLSILPDMTVMACRKHNGSGLGKWKKEGDLMKKFFLHPKMDKFRQINKIEACGTCELKLYCRGCRAVAFAATGNIWGKDPQCSLCNEI